MTLSERLISNYENRESRIYSNFLENGSKKRETPIQKLYVHSNIDFAFSLLITHIYELQEVKKEVKKDGRVFLTDVIGAFELYEALLRYTFHYNDYDPELYSDIYENKEAPTRYPKIPLDKEFSQYLKDSKFSDKVRYKMMTNLRKLNALVINNGRGESDWLQSVVDKVKAGINIRYTRLIADHSVHAAIEILMEQRV